MSERPVVVTGAAGLLGSAFMAQLPGAVPLGRDALDPAAPADIRRRLAGIGPGLIVNCAADTDVEGAEDDPSRAFAVNAGLAETLAAAACELGAALVHVSSTGCYGDWKTTPYVEGDALRPTTQHHRSKAEGEERVLRAHPQALVLRLGWVFGGRPAQRKNFVWARIQEAKGREQIGSNPAQMGCPTSADDVAHQAMMLVARGEAGVFNCVGEGEPASRLDYVRAILLLANSGTQVVPVVFPRRAPVSSNEAALNARLQADGLSRMPDWRPSLDRFIEGQFADRAAM